MPLIIPLSALNVFETLPEPNNADVKGSEPSSSRGLPASRLSLSSRGREGGLALSLDGGFSSSDFICVSTSCLVDLLFFFLEPAEGVCVEGDVSGPSASLAVEVCESSGLPRAAFLSEREVVRLVVRVLATFVGSSVYLEEDLGGSVTSV